MATNKEININGVMTPVTDFDHSAQEIDDATTRALAGGDLDQDIAKKMDATESADYPGCYYRMVDGVHEWINPPMALGVEYRTTERYQGKPIYAKCVDFGTLPNSGRKQMAYTESGGFHVISISGNANGATNNFPIPSSTIAVVKAYANSASVFLDTEGDLSAYTAYVIVKYTKG